ncbi:hypothetical protein ACH427_04050 [Streptomyces sp. NPDC020379]|uniref:hypothetical protein n=1 Tax=Streptomyces sp. NPDC020379 TaxID=3365071 RepID=UPI00379DBE72
MTLDLGNLKAASTEPAKAQTAFLVVVDVDGSVSVSTDLNNPPAVERPASFTDIRTASYVVQEDIKAMQISALVQQKMMAVGQMVQQQMQTEALAKSLRI